MNKVGRIVIIVVLVSGLIGGFYYLFMRPIGFTSSNEVVSSYMNQLSNESCETHFIEETQDVCEQFVTLLEDETFEVIEITGTGSEIDVLIKVNEIEETFTFYVTTEEVSGLRGILNSTYYYIDHIE